MHEYKHSSYSHIHKASILSRAHILYDVNFTTWKVAHCYVTDNEMRGKIATDEEAYMWIERQIQTAIANIRRKMKFALGCKHSVDDNRLDTDIPGLYGSQCLDPEFDYSQVPDCCGCGGECSCGCDGERKVQLPREYVFNWTFDEEWDGDLEALTSLIHHYIVAYVLWHWFLLVGLSRAGTLLRSTLADEFREEAEQALEDAANEGRNEQVRNMIFIL